MQQVHLVIEGRVQGVGFRWFALHRARELSLAGQVWNRGDGTVEIVAEGDARRLAEFVTSMRQGPRSAHVSRVDESWSEGPARHRDFVIA
jgi:acylphosphatase